jgi:RHS repeat-associated protein
MMNGSGEIEARHDYLPFGEEIQSDVELRTAAKHYAAVDSTRQRYSGMERDANGLDQTLWRKYESRAGRWTTPDPYSGSMTVGDPQSFNRYTYVGNDPINFVDPSDLIR